MSVLQRLRNPVLTKLLGESISSYVEFGNYESVEPECRHTHTSFWPWAELSDLCRETCMWEIGMPYFIVLCIYLF